MQPVKRGVREVKREFLEKSRVCVKREDYISHLPLSLTVGVHPPWVFADRQIPAVIYSKNYSVRAIDRHDDTAVNNPIN